MICQSCRTQTVALDRYVFRIHDSRKALIVGTRRGVLMNVIATSMIMTVAKRMMIGRFVKIVDRQIARVWMLIEELINYFV